MSFDMSKAPKPEFTQTEVKCDNVKIVEADILKILYSKGRKYYMRLKRKNTNTGMEKPYVDFYKTLNLTKEEADRLFYRHLVKSYPHLVELIKRESN